MTTERHPRPVRRQTTRRRPAFRWGDPSPAGLAALAEVDEGVPRREAVAAHVHEKGGDLGLAARLNEQLRGVDT